MLDSPTTSVSEPLHSVDANDLPAPASVPEMELPAERQVVTLNGTAGQVVTLSGPDGQAVALNGLAVSEVPRLDQDLNAFEQDTSRMINISLNLTWQVSQVASAPVASASAATARAPVSSTPASSASAASAPAASAPASEPGSVLDSPLSLQESEGDVALREALDRMRRAPSTNTNANLTDLPLCESPAGLSAELDTSTDNTPPRAILRWDAVNGTDTEQLLVEVHGPDGVFVFPVEFPPRQRQDLGPRLEDFNRRVEELQSRIGMHNIDPAAYSGSDLPLDQLYKQELDWVTSHQDEVYGPARVIGVDHEPDESTGAESDVPPARILWTVIQEAGIVSSRRWVSGGVLGEGTYAKVFHVHHKPSRNAMAMKVIYMKRPLSATVCQGIINELKVLELLAMQENPLPFALAPHAVAGKWAWTSSEGFLHILTVGA